MERRVLAVVLIATLAGCGAIAGPQDVTETVTPAPVPTPPTENSATPDDAPTTVAPGIAPDGIVDLEALLDHHRSVITNTSFVMEDERRETDVRTNELRNVPQSRRTVYGDDGSYWRYESAIDPDDPSRLRYVRDFEQYGTGERAYSKWDVVGRSNTTFERLDDHPLSRNLGTPIVTFQRYLGLENETVTRYDVGERSHYVVRGTRSSVGRYGAVENFSTRVVVREDGLIRRLDVSFVADDDGEPVAVEYTARYSRLGNATVTPPEWLPTARERTGGG